jgi:hypothetical protein
LKLSKRKRGAEISAPVFILQPRSGDSGAMLLSRFSRLHEAAFDLAVPVAQLLERGAAQPLGNERAQVELRFRFGEFFR